MTRTSLLRALLFGALLAVAGCSGGDDDPAPAMTLYVAGGQFPAIHAFASTAAGNVAPDRLISGASTTLSSPFGIDHDSRTDSVFATTFASVVIYDGASQKTGNIAPSRLVTGASTGFNVANSIAVDEGRDLLYVGGGHGVSVFANARTVTGDVAPARVIAGGATQFSGLERRIHLDAAHDRLYVAVPSGPRVLVFDAVSTKNGDVAPDRVISGASTTFLFPWGLAVDAQRDLVYVGDQGDNSVMVFANASTATGDVAPSRKIQGAATLIAGVSDIFVDEGTDTIYVADADSDAVLVWSAASTRDGDVAPTRSIAGASTGLNYPGGLTVAR